MFTYETRKTRYGREDIACFADGVEIAHIQPNAHNGKIREYTISCLDENGEMRGYLGRVSILAEARKKISDWYSEKGREIAEFSRKKRTSDVRRLPAFDGGEFYPTPSKLAGRMIALIDWKNVRSALEPSAGRGDLADAAISFASSYRGAKKVRFNERESWIDCIEIDPDLSHILRGKGYHVVGDDFLSFHSLKKYDLILMNPPFSNGDEHLLKAISLMERGGQIVCLLNAETIRNPYTNRRYLLAQKLAEYNAKIEFISGAFSHAARKTDVEIALVYLNIAPKIQHSDILESLKKQRVPAGRENPETEATALSSGNWIENLIDGFDFEARIGQKMIEEYEALLPYLEKGMGQYSKPLLELNIPSSGAPNDFSRINHFLHSLRAKYWRLLLERPELTEKMTSAMQREYLDKIRTLSDYDFDRYNIQTFVREISHQLTSGIEESIMNLFESFSAKHSWYPECEKNVHYYNGWATNKAHKVGMKVIIPANGCCADSWRDEKLDEYRVVALISDLERAMNYLDRGETTFRSSASSAVKIANINDMNKARFTWFDCTFYKKGTCHIKFNENARRIIDRLNIFAAQKKNWLPPTYGKKHYADMTAEEKAVIDDFQGEKEYEAILADPSMLISSGDLAFSALPAHS